MGIKSEVLFPVLKKKRFLISELRPASTHWTEDLVLFSTYVNKVIKFDEILLLKKFQLTKQ